MWPWMGYPDGRSQHRAEMAGNGASSSSCSRSHLEKSSCPHTQILFFFLEPPIAPEIRYMFLLLSLSNEPELVHVLLGIQEENVSFPTILYIYPFG